MVEHDAVVKNAKLHIREVQGVACYLREFFPVANGVIRDVADGSADESELVIVNCMVFNKALYDVQGVAGFFSVFFAGSFVAGYCYSIFYLDGYPRVKSYE